MTGAELVIVVITGGLELLELQEILVDSGRSHILGLILASVSKFTLLRIFRHIEALGLVTSNRIHSSASSFSPTDLLVHFLVSWLRLVRILAQSRKDKLVTTTSPSCMIAWRLSLTLTIATWSLLILR